MTSLPVHDVRKAGCNCGFRFSHFFHSPEQSSLTSFSISHSASGINFIFPQPLPHPVLLQWLLPTLLRGSYGIQSTLRSTCSDGFTRLESAPFTAFPVRGLLPTQSGCFLTAHVAGDYNLTALDYLPQCGLHWAGNCNELNAGAALQTWLLSLLV